MPPNLRRLAALDMWGTAGTTRRRRIVRAEFFVGALGCLVLGVLGLLHGGGWLVVVGLWLVGVGVNYVPLALYAQALSGAGALEAELHGSDVRRELRHAGVQQLWILVPFAVAIAALAQEREKRRR